MLVDHVMRRPSFSQIYRFKSTPQSHYNPKVIGKIYGQKAKRAYTSAKFRGGSFKDFWNTVKRIGKKIYRPIKTAVHWLANSDVGKKVVDGVAKVARNVVPYIPVVGPAIAPVIETALPQIVQTVDKVTDIAEQLSSAIKDKNPGIAIDDAKKIGSEIANTYNKIKTAYQQGKEPNIQAIQQQAASNLEDIKSNIGDAVKAEGLDRVLKVAKYLPLIKKGTLKTEEKQGKGGRILSHVKVTKPGKEIRAILGDKADKEYSAGICGKVCGRIYNKVPKQNIPVTGPDARLIKSESKQSQTEDSGRLRMSGRLGLGGKTSETKKEASPLDILKMKLKI